MEIKENPILIVEDEKTIADVLVFKIEKAGFPIEIVSNGQEALDLLEKKQFSLIVLDITMPKMDGTTLLREMRKRNIDIPVIVVSNISAEKYEKRAKEFNIKKYFVKSDASIAEIIDCIKSTLSTK